MRNQQEEDMITDFRRIFRKLPGLYLILALDDYQIVDASDAYLQATRHERDDILGQKLFQDQTSFRGPQAASMKQLQASLEKVKTEKRPDTMAILPHPIHKPGKENSFETRWWSPVNAPIFNSEGEIEYIIHRIEDVTPIIHQMQGKNSNLLQELEAEEAHLTADILLRGRDLQNEKEKAINNLRKSEAKYRTLFESIDEGFCILEKVEQVQEPVSDYRFLEANPGFETQSGLKNPVGKTVLDVVPEIEEGILRVMDYVVETGKSLRYEDYISSLDMWVSAFIFRFDISGPERLGILFNNITERKKVEEALRSSKEKYQTLFESIDAGFFIMEVLFDEHDQANDLRFLETNPSFETQSGIEGAEGKSISQIITQLEDDWFEIFGNVALNHEPIRFVQGAEALDRIFDVYAFPIGQPEEHKVAVLFSDITERKQTEKELRESKNRLSTALEIDTVGIIFWGSDFTITEANEAFLHMSGFSYEEIIGKTWQDLTPEKFHAVSKKAIADIKSTGHSEPYEKQYYRKDGSRWWGLFAPRQISDNETVEYVLDITDRKQREQRDQFLLKLNDTLRPLSNSSEISNKAIQLLQKQFKANRVLYIESTPEGQFAVKKDVTDGVPSIEGEINLSDFGSSFVDTLQAGETYVERDALKDPKLKSEEKKSFQQIDVQSKIAVPLLRDDELAIVLAVEKADPYDWSEHEVALVEETAERTWAYIERLRAEEKLIALKNNLEDRVKERTAALRSYQNQLRSLASRLNKAEQKEQNRLASELHDNLGQLLTLCKIKVHNIKKNSNLPDVTDEVNDLFELIDDALTYTRELTSDLKPPPSLSKEDFSEILDWIIKKMEKHNLNVIIEDDNKPKPLDEEVRIPLHQSVKELLFNVIKHSGENEAHVTISREGEMMKVTVEDHGKGFNMKGEEPVLTDEGGFGLFNIRERMDFIGGKFEIFSEPSDGTKAILYAPLKEKKPVNMTSGKEKQEALPVEEEAAPTELLQEIKVLIADDHDMVRRGLRNLIEAQDDMIITAEAGNGKEALELARKTRPDVVVMDINMPVMDGIEATRKIVSSLPNIHVIGLSFYGQEEVAKNMRDAGASAYMSKDEAFEALCATIRSEATIYR